MLKWAILFFILGVIFALFGFTRLAGISTQIAKVLFVIFLIIFVILLFLAWTFL